MSGAAPLVQTRSSASAGLAFSVLFALAFVASAFLARGVELSGAGFTKIGLLTDQEQKQ